MKKFYLVLSAICLISATAVIAEEIEIPGWAGGSSSSSYTTGSGSASSYSSSNTATSAASTTSTSANSIKATRSTASSTAATAETGNSDEPTAAETLENVEKNIETHTTSVHKSVKNVYDSVNMIKGIRF